MKNRFKFRVWHKPTLKFLTNEFGGEYLLGLDGSIRLAKLNDDEHSVFDPLENQEDYVIQQFTGFVDKDGTEIYEGDILIHKSDYAEVVEWGDFSHLSEVSFNGLCFCVGRYPLADYAEELNKLAEECVCGHIYSGDINREKYYKENE